MVQMVIQTANVSQSPEQVLELGLGFPHFLPLLVLKFLMKETGKLGLDGVLEHISTVQVIK